MERKDVFERLNSVFREVFDDENIVLGEETTADDIDEWDSLEHITLIGAIESEFRMRFKMHEVSTMKNVGEMVDIIAARARR